MGAITDILNKYDYNIDSLDNLYDIFKNVSDYDIPIVRFTLYKGTGLIRQRINSKGEEFHYVSELSYPPAACLTKLGRANFKRKLQVFDKRTFTTYNRNINAQFSG